MGQVSSKVGCKTTSVRTFVVASFKGRIQNTRWHLHFVFNQSRNNVAEFASSFEQPHLHPGTHVFANVDGHLRVVGIAVLGAWPSHFLRRGDCGTDRSLRRGRFSCRISLPLLVSATPQSPFCIRNLTFRFVSTAVPTRFLALTGIRCHG